MDQSIVEKRDHNSCLFVFTALMFYEKNDLFYFATTFKVNGSKQSSMAVQRDAADVRKI